MLQIVNPVPRGVTLATLLAAFVLSISSGASVADLRGGPGIGLSNVPPQLAQAAAPQSPSAQSAAPQSQGKSAGKAVTPVAPIDRQIRDLHKKLGITSAQETLWADVAAAMRDEANNADAYFRQRKASASTMTAVEDLNSYQQFAQTRADALKKVATAFEALYASMPDDQKKKADKVFRDFQRHGRRGSASKSTAPKSN